jgi:hypothetical protein
VGAAGAEGVPAGHLKHNPRNPQWFDRDRFVLSNGHASMLMYALLHLTGYALPMAELKNFRQLHSKTPGHPENGITPGVETTTGPLGQGFANAVGMALAEKLLAREFNREGHAIVDHSTYVFMGDGCMMEGISHEAAALAGPGNSTSWWLCTTTTAFPSTGRWPPGLPTTQPCVSWPMAGMCWARSTATTRPWWPRRWSMPGIPPSDPR